MTLNEFLKTRQYLINIFQNDRNNTIIETYKDFREIEFDNEAFTFENVIINDKEFLQMIFDSCKDEILDIEF